MPSNVTRVKQARDALSRAMTKRCNQHTVTVAVEKSVLQVIITLFSNEYSLCINVVSLSETCTSSNVDIPVHLCLLLKTRLVVWVS